MKTAQSKTVRVQGVCMAGVHAALVTVEARFDSREKGGTEVNITGLPDPVIRESRSRLLCALRESRLTVPQGVLMVNLVPAAQRKIGGSLDLAIALCAAAACGHLDPKWLQDHLYLGELGIDGRLHTVPGGLAAAICAREHGIQRLIAPFDTAQQAAWIDGVRCMGAKHLLEVVTHLAGGDPQLAPIHAADPLSQLAPTKSLTIDDVRGQSLAKRTLAIAALGGHGLLFVGPPGAGKTMLARRITSLLPAPTLEQRIQITLSLAAANIWPEGLASERPFRAPHHTTSYAGLVGGGSPPQPGEITLAHEGILFLDELPEFQRESLEALRQPLESGSVCIGRAGSRMEFPAAFQLAAAMNPCPCGMHGHPRVPCRCSEPMIARYRRRISGPLLDRIELRLELAPPSLDELLPGQSPARRAPGEWTHAQLTGQVQKGLERAKKRQGDKSNRQLNGEELDALAPMDEASHLLMKSACEHSAFSGRAIQGLRRVARTLADLADEDHVKAQHLAQAIALRGGFG